MGLFLSMSGVLGAKTAEVESTLKTFCVDRKGKFEAKKLGTDERNCLVLREDKGGCSLLYPNNFMDWDEASKFISRELQKPVFSFHIHDGDLWMYLFFVNGEQKDQFNPIPQYWDEDEDPEPWAGDAKKLAAAIPGLKAEDVAKYLVPWDLDAEESEKAYPDDEHSTREDWQLLDFMRRLGLSYPGPEGDEIKGSTYYFKA